MKETTDETRLDALNSNIVKSREEIAALAASFKKLAEWAVANSIVYEERPPEVFANGEKHNGKWRGFRHGLGEAGARGNAVAKGIADEIERHPLIGGMVAFGLGLWIATALFKRSGSEPTQ